MIGARRTCLALAWAALVACGEREQKTLPPFGQLLLHVDTDAPLPAAPGKTLGPDDSPPLFDRVRVEVFLPGARTPCADCTHEFDLDREVVAAGKASLGITPPVGIEGLTARVRLYSARFTQSAEIRADASLDTVVALPPVAAEGVVPVTVRLRTEDLGHPVGSFDQPAAVESGPPTPGFSGSWAPARRKACAGAAGPDEVCVPGGAYWMGHPLTQQGSPLIGHRGMRLVVLAPFFMDKTEVTVGAFRAAGVATDKDPQRYSAASEPGAGTPCTYTTDPGNYENMPVDCVSWERATDYCAARGRALPTEAQYQYAAGALSTRLFVWGDDAPACSDAIYARAFNLLPALVRCDGAWVEPPGTGLRDRLKLPGGEIWDLAGNVAEHAQDVWNDGCWQAGILVDPVCDQPSSDKDARFSNAHSVVGGAWTETAAALPAATGGRGFIFNKMISSSVRDESSPQLASVGFRCARPADDR